jgi:hypothetical protein
MVSHCVCGRGTDAKQAAGARFRSGGRVKAVGGGRGDPKGARGSGVEAAADRDVSIAREGGGNLHPNQNRAAGARLLTGVANSTRDGPGES